jgi:hypothetical protein
MSHHYEAHASDGQTYNVTTQHHHDDHEDATFKRHLLDVIKGSISGVAAGAVLRFVYRGQR